MSRYTGVDPFGDSPDAYSIKTPKAMAASLSGPETPPRVHVNADYLSKQVLQDAMDLAELANHVAGFIVGPYPTSAEKESINKAPESIMEDIEDRIISSMNMIARTKDALHALSAYFDIHKRHEERDR